MSWRWTTALLLLLAGCIVSPVPQPPNVEPPELEVSDALAVPCENCDTDAVRLEAPAGSVSHDEVSPSQVTLWVTNLDSTDPPQSFAVADDGSFVASALGDVGDVFRLQARLGELRSAPIDVVAPPGGGAVLEASHPLAPCFTVTPSPELDLGQAPAGRIEVIELHNGCGEALAISRLELRVPSEAFAVTSPFTSVEVDETLLVDVELLSGASGAPVEAILLIEVSGVGSTDRRAVSLFAVVE